MKTMNSLREPASFEQYFAGKAAPLHRCPVCGTVHEVSAARAQFAYGRQLTCSSDCEAERRRRSRASYRLAPALVTGNKSAKAGAGRLSRTGAEPMSLKLVTLGGEPASKGSNIAEDVEPVGLSTLVVGDRDQSSSHQPTRHLAGLSEPKAVLSVTVESADVLPVRRAIFQAGGQSVGILKALPIPHSTKVRLFVRISADALEPIRRAVMRSVSAGEFGRLARM